MIHLPRASHPDQPGPWWRPALDGGKRTASMMCPHGHRLSLNNHVIHNDGSVTPSVVCAVPGCVFHQHVRLIGWTG